MGMYINPKGQSKESWLAANAKLLPGQPTYPPPVGTAIVCLVNNVVFTAAGVCYSESELEAFSNPLDGRTKKWYNVSLALLAEVCPDDFRRYFQ